MTPYNQKRDTKLWVCMLSVICLLLFQGMCLELSQLTDEIYSRMVYQGQPVVVLFHSGWSEQSQRTTASDSQPIVYSLPLPRQLPEVIRSSWTFCHCPIDHVLRSKAMKYMGAKEWNHPEQTVIGSACGAGSTNCGANGNSTKGSGTLEEAMSRYTLVASQYPSSFEFKQDQFSESNVYKFMLDLTLKVQTPINRASAPLDWTQVNLSLHQCNITIPINVNELSTDSLIEFFKNSEDQDNHLPPVTPLELSSQDVISQQFIDDLHPFLVLHCMSILPSCVEAKKIFTQVLSHLVGSNKIVYAFSDELDNYIKGAPYQKRSHIVRKTVSSRSKSNQKASKNNQAVTQYCSSATIIFYDEEKWHYPDYFELWPQGCQEAYQQAKDQMKCVLSSCSSTNSKNTDQFMVGQLKRLTQWAKTMEKYWPEIKRKREQRMGQPRSNQPEQQFVGQSEMDSDCPACSQSDS